MLDYFKTTLFLNMKYLLLNFKEIPTYGWIEYSEQKGLVLSEQEMFSKFLDDKRFG